MARGTWRSLLELADGSISARLGPGTIAGINIESFLERAEQGGFFALGEVSGGTFAFDSAEVKATILDGVARLDVAKAESPRLTISLSGLIPFVESGLAMSGLITPKETAPGETAPRMATAFFVGGSWNAPFVSPIQQSFPLE